MRVGRILTEEEKWQWRQREDRDRKRRPILAKLQEAKGKKFRGADWSAIAKFVGLDHSTTVTLLRGMKSEGLVYTDYGRWAITAKGQRELLTLNARHK